MSIITEERVDEDILLRVERLLRQATRTEYPQEAEAFQRKAFQIMSRHRITQAMLNLDSDNDLIVEEALVTLDGRYAKAFSHAIGWIARAYDVEVVWTSRGYQRQVRAHGFKSDVERVRFLANHLTADGQYQAAKVSRRTAATTVSARIQFYETYFLTVKRRLLEAVRDAIVDSEESWDEEIEVDGVTYVLVNNEIVEKPESKGALVLLQRKEQVKDSFKKANPRTRTEGSPSCRRYDTDAREAGKQAGRSVDLHNRQKLSRGVAALNA